jgi:hypothetical protein
MHAKQILTTMILGISTATVAWTQTDPGFSFAGEMQTARLNHTATLLNDGRVLIAGGTNTGGTLSSVELFDPASGSFTSAGNMTSPRAYHSATLLADGRVLIAGGLRATGAPPDLLTAELFDPATNTFQRTGDLTRTRVRHAATRLANGTVLLTGGNSDGSIEIYDPIAGTFTAVDGQTTMTDNGPGDAVLLASGSVFLAEGGGTQAFDAHADTLASTGTATDSQTFPQTTLLLSGKVLISGNAGALDDNGDDVIDPGPGTSSDLYDPTADPSTAFTRTTVPGSSRTAHVAVLLADGTVLLAGGITPGIGPVRSEIYDPVQDTFQALGDMVRPRIYPAAVLLADGRVFIVGGAASDSTTTPAIATAEIYTPAKVIAKPVMLSLSGDGSGPGAILHADTHLPVTSDNPAGSGEPLEVYVTGLADGVIPPSMSVGGRTAEVLWFGSSPVYSGLSQINIRVPDGVTSGDAKVRLNYLGRPSNEVTLAVQSDAARARK